MSDPARSMSREDALDELYQIQSDGWILLEGSPSSTWVNLDGWDPSNQWKQDGNVAGVVISYLPGGVYAPDWLDPRNALALVRLCQWLNSSWGVTELYHLGINGDPSGGRTDCHGQGRAVDFAGVAGTSPEDGSWFRLSVLDDWGTTATAWTPGGTWPPGTGANVTYRLDDPDTSWMARDFFRQFYEFVAGEWQDRHNTPEGWDTATAIGEPSFIMHPDHPASAPGTLHGREAHRNHVHMQIGVTGTEH